jgi:hypothetical protein|tara:strand:+ start:37 stop:189 length:153 start_codon:yes stop_codon:yes gene_type:complete
MKKFEITDKNNNKKIMVTLYNPPYENKNILHKTGWKEEDVTIKELYVGEE